MSLPRTDWKSGSGKHAGTMIEFHQSLISYKLSMTQSRCPSPDKEYLLKISYDPTAIYDCFLSGKITSKRNSEAEENSKKKDSTGVSKNRNRCRLSIKIRMKVKGTAGNVRNGERVIRN